MGNEKVTEKEIAKAWQQFAGGSRYANQFALPQLPNIMNSPQGFNMMMGQPVPQMVAPPAQQLSPAQNAQLSAQQMMGMQMMAGQAPMNPNVAQYKTLGHQCKVRTGTPKVRVWGVCKDCGNFWPNEKDAKELGWCNAKNCRTHPESGKVETTFKDAAGKETKLVDSEKSCRIWTPIH